MFAATDEPAGALRVAAQRPRARCRARTSRTAAPPRDQAFRDQGITFSLSGEERPFPLDLVPRIIAADEWAVVEAGVRQRVLALERFLADVYGPGEILADGVVPRRLVMSSSHFHRAAAGFEPAGGVRVHVAGIDLVRDAGRQLLRARGQPAHPVGHLLRHREPPRDDPRLPRAVREPPHPPCRGLPAPPARGAARDRAARGRRPVRRRAHPGVHNAAYFEHSFLARQMGVELVEGRDLVCRDQHVFMRTTSGEHRSTSSTGASTTTSSTRCTSGPTRCSGAPASSTRRAPAT